MSARSRVGQAAAPLPSSSGGPAAAAGASRTSGALAVVVPSGRGAPGAFGSALGSNASDFRGLGGAAGSPGLKGASATSGAGGAPSERSPNRTSTSWRNLCSSVSSSMLGVLQLLDPAIGLPQLRLELVDTQDQLGGLVRVARIVGRRRLAVERIELGLRRRCERDARDERRHEAQARQSRHWRFPRWDLVRGPISRASVDFKSSRKRWRTDQLLPGAPLSTVTARRFCDQQEMSSQTATGRSLP